MTKKTSQPAIEIKMATIMAVSATLYSADTSAIEKNLKATTGGKDDFFDGEFVVIDVGPLAEAASTVDWPLIIPLFRKYNLNPVAVRNAPAELAAVISAHGLSIDTISGLSKTVNNAPESEEALDSVVETEQLVVSPRTMVIDQPVRGGQTVYARDCDMIVTAVVNSGAEIIADGSIFVFAPLRGRALAGAKGDITARILTTSMNAELISIAGTYKTFEQGMPDKIKGRSVKISLREEKIEISPIDPTSRA